MVRINIGLKVAGIHIISGKFLCLVITINFDKRSAIFVNLLQFKIFWEKETGGKSEFSASHVKQKVFIEIQLEREFGEPELKDKATS